jgi:hypothetical protein
MKTIKGYKGCGRKREEAFPWFLQNFLQGLRNISLLN